MNKKVEQREERERESGNAGRVTASGLRTGGTRGALGRRDPERGAVKGVTRTGDKG